MLIGSLVKATVELQGFRVMHVAGNADGLVATLGPDRRYGPRCGRRREPAPYRDTRRIRQFRHVPIGGGGGGATIRAAAGELFLGAPVCVSSRCRG